MFISFTSRDGSCSLCVVLSDLSHYMYLHLQTSFLDVSEYIYIYSYIQTHVIMHSWCIAIMYCKCFCVCVCLCLRWMDRDMCSFAGCDISDISTSC